uniref:hypothetical protein n=1 Tax=Candidatus Limisoma sp. TaxID=3076476 RepID=UPI0040299DD5
MIFIFATAIYGYAQEAPAAEQNDDKTLDSRHQNRRTMRGYKAFYDVEYGFDIDDEEKDWEGGYIAGYPHCNNFIISTTQGYQFNNFFFLGGGLGLLRYIDGKKTMMPIFAETSINLLNNKRVMPFLQARLGTVVGEWGGVYYSAICGVRLKVAQRHAVSLSLIMSDHFDVESFINDQDDGISWFARSLGIKLGFEF